MAINLNDNIKVLAGKPTDARYLNNLTPYADVSTANAAIASNLRFTGLTVNISGEEYWYKDGITDIDLIPKDNSTDATATYDKVWMSGTTDTGLNLKTWYDTVESAGRISGGTITQGVGQSVNVAAGSGLIKDGTGDTAQNRYVSWSAVTNLAIDTGYNYIYYDAIDKAVKATTNEAQIERNDNFNLGRVFYDDTLNLIILRLCGQNLWNLNRRIHLYGDQVYGVQRASGLITTSVSGLTIQVSGGVLWAELLNRFSTEDFDSRTDDFREWYKTGGNWAAPNITGGSLNNTHYNQGSASYTPLTEDYYTIRWVYVVHDGSIHVVYDTNQYSGLTQAQLASPPAVIPPMISGYATLSARVIVQEGNSTIVEVDSAYEQVFVTQSVATHNDLGGIQGGQAGEYYHLTAAQVVEVDNIGDKLDTTVFNGYTGTTQPILDSALTGATNGLTKTGRNVELGGALTKDTSITGNYTLNFSDDAKLNTTCGYQINGVTVFNTPITSDNIAIGESVLLNVSGCGNIGIGYEALAANDGGNDNIGMGQLSLAANTSGSNNIAIGNEALFANTSGNDNIGFGSCSLQNNEGSCNIGIGKLALRYNETGNNNVAIGYATLSLNISSCNNVAIGNEVLCCSCCGNNIGIGWTALNVNTTGINNIALSRSLNSNTTGSCNIGIGCGALTKNTEGSRNIAIGMCAGCSNICGSGSTFIGYHAGRNETDSNKLHIANAGTCSLIYGEFNNKLVCIDNKLITCQLQVLSGVTNGYVLTSDASGNATWQATQAGSSTLTGATNGLSKVGQNAELGGALTKDTSITGAYDLSLGTAGSPLDLFDINTSGNITVDTDANLNIIVSGGTVTTNDGKGLRYISSAYTSTFVDDSLVTKLYVDTVASGLDPKSAVLVATTGNTTLSGTSQTIDGVTIVAGDRVLVKNQNDAEDNGIYDVAAGVWSRSSDFDGAPTGEVTEGALIPVLSGNTQINSSWILITKNPITVGTTELVFTKFSQLLDVSAGDGIRIDTVGLTKEINVELASNSGLEFSGGDLTVNLADNSGLQLLSTGLTVNSAIAGNALDWNAGVIDVNIEDINTQLGGVLSGVTNGLSEIDGVVELGGDLTKDTTINLLTNSLNFCGISGLAGGSAIFKWDCICFSVADSPATCLSLNSTSVFANTYTGDIILTSGNDFCASANNLLELCFAGTGTICDISGTPAGLQYAACYHNTYTDRSLVDREYVNTQISTSAITAGLGLCNNNNVFDVNVIDTPVIGTELNVKVDSSDTELLYVDSQDVSAAIAQPNPTGITIDVYDNVGLLVVQSEDVSAAIAQPNPTGTTIDVYDNGGLLVIQASDIQAEMTGNTFTNGLTDTSGVVSLGGALTGDTTISGGSKILCLGTAVDRLSNFCVQASNEVCLHSELNTKINGENMLELNYGGGFKRIRLDVDEMLVSDGTTSKGLIYGGDYEANFTARSLVTQQYVTGLTTTSGVQTATNGLTKTGTNVVLGGTLTGDTTIDSGSNVFRVCDSNNYGISVSGSSPTIGDITNTNTYINVDSTGIVCIKASTANNMYLDAVNDCIALETGGGYLALCGGVSDLGGIGTSGGAYMSVDGLNGTATISNDGTNGIFIDNTGVCVIGAIFATTTPTVGSTSDSVLVRDGGSGEIKTVDGANLGEHNNIYKMTVVTTDVTLTTGSTYVQLVSGATSGLTITLPATPLNGQVFRIKDAANAALSYAISVDGNGNDIDKSSTPAMLNTDGGALELVWNAALNSWYVFSFVN